ncbi:histidinol dehydrogenase [Pseudahrensia aquimaris]|uniref:Histidinol dehydrogenase n=1 Tax=Pseudahrensia aquimaris TaxID=744461 RepID=A0ABW3FDV9_9HYPH
MTDQTVALHELIKLSQAERAQLLLRAEDDLAPFIAKVAPIIEAVRTEGDDALIRFAAEFDGANIAPGTLQASEAEIEEAYSSLDPEFVEVLRYSADNIRRFHEMQMPKDMEWWTEIRPGVHVGERFTAIDSVACYSPRGKGSFPSVTLMSVIPAIVAGVEKVAVLTPAGPDGKIDSATLVAADIAGCRTVFKAGGAQAVAAAAFGTETIPRVMKIEGPGSPWLAAAKVVLSNRIDPGMPAGPSESIVFADETANPRIAALDTIIESEHGDDSSVFLVTTSRELAEAARAAIPDYWAHMSEERVGYSSAVLGGNSGGIVLAENTQAAYDFINDYAPEHCQILSAKPEQHLPHIRNASEILLGEQTPGSVANYMMGPNCVLPTSGAAKTRSPLGVHNFLKACSLGRMTEQGLAETGPKTEVFATYEGFDAHANAVGELRRKAFGNE